MNDKEQETARLSGGVRLCSGCRLHPSRPQQRTCPACHATYQKAYRLRRKNYVRELQAIIDGLTGKDPATEDTWRKVVGSRHVLVVPPEDSLADVFAGLVTGFSAFTAQQAHASESKDEHHPVLKMSRGAKLENPTKGRGVDFCASITPARNLQIEPHQPSPTRRRIADHGGLEFHTDEHG